MFKGKIYLSKKEGDKEEKIEQEFDNEKEFDAFIEKNPDLRQLRDFQWTPVRWPDSLLGMRSFFEEAEKEEKFDILSEMERDMNQLFERSRKLLGK